MQPAKKIVFKLPTGLLPQFPLDKLTQGDRVIHVQNLELAAALFQIGVPLRKDPSHTVRIERGHKIATFNFAGSSRDGKHDTVILIRGWKHPVEWLSQHPNHPWSVHVEVKMNTYAMRAKAESEIPFLVFQPGDNANVHCFVRQGSQRETSARANGWRQI